MGRMLVLAWAVWMVLGALKPATALAAAPQGVSPQLPSTGWAALADRLPDWLPIHPAKLLARRPSATRVSFASYLKLPIFSMSLADQRPLEVGIGMGANPQSPEQRGRRGPGLFGGGAGQNLLDRSVCGVYVSLAW